MTCRYPLTGVRKKGSKNKPMIFGTKPETLADAYEALEIPCTRCIGCRLEQQRQWGIRCAHEAAIIWEEFSLPSSFITLTYDDNHLPIDFSLSVKELQDFYKRFRRRIEPNKIRHYSSGEYGSQCPKHKLKNCPMCGPIQRPHYHAIVFGWAFPDRHQCGERDGLPIYESEFLNEVWPYGLHEIGSVTFESAAYVAGYITKKITGKKAEDHYMRYCPLRDNWYTVAPEFHIMSTKPGIGARWIQRYITDVYPHDDVPIPGRGTQKGPPNYYDKFAEAYGFDLDQIKQTRREEFAKSLLEGPSLHSRAMNQDARLARKRRSL